MMDKGYCYLASQYSKEMLCTRCFNGYSLNSSSYKCTKG